MDEEESIDQTFAVFINNLRHYLFPAAQAIHMLAMPSRSISEEEQKQLLEITMDSHKRLREIISEAQDYFMPRLRPSPPDKAQENS